MREVKEKKKKFSEKIAHGIDRVISIISPQAGFQRKLFRFAQDYALKSFGSYRGAGKHRLRADWLPGSGSADENLLPDLALLRERSRDLMRNDGIASGAVDTLVTNIIGTGIKPQSRIDKENLGINDEVAEKLQKKIERIWEKWVPYADAGNRMNFYELEELAERQRFVNGEVIIIPLRVEEPGRPYSLALQVVEADRLSTPGDKRGDKNIRHGVEIGSRGEPVAYWIRKTHPGDVTVGRYTSNNNREYIRYQAKDILGLPRIFHLYHVKRPGQTRGEPFLSPVLTYFKDHADYMEAELVAARIAACFAVFVKKNKAYTAAINRASSNSGGQRVESLEPGMLEYLNPGEEIQTFSPNRPGGTFDIFVERILRLISSGLNLPYEVVAKDFSKTNYSSARAALLEARKFFRKQQGFIANKLAQPVWSLLIEEAFLKGELDDIFDFYSNRSEWTRARWIAPGWQWVDPLKEVKASEQALNIGLSTLADEAAAQGKDWEEMLEQRAREEKKTKDLEEKYGVKIIKGGKSAEKDSEVEKEAIIEEIISAAK